MERIGNERERATERERERERERKREREREREREGENCVTLRVSPTAREILISPQSQSKSI